MKKISLTRGKFALVDDADYEHLSQWKWFCESNNYAARDLYLGGGRANQKQKRIKMHRVIMGDPQFMEIDHIDGDGLNNQRTNLRVATHAQNMKNLKRPKHNVSGYKGVYWSKPRSKWVAAIWLDGRPVNLGGFASKEEAAQKYNAIAMEKYGEFARLNRV